MNNLPKKMDKVFQLTDTWSSEICKVIKTEDDPVHLLDYIGVMDSTTKFLREMIRGRIVELVSDIKTMKEKADKYDKMVEMMNE